MNKKLSQWSSALYGRSSFSSGIPFYLILLPPKAFDSFNNDFCNWLFFFFLFFLVFGNVLPQLITSYPERKSYNKNFKVILSFYTKWKFLFPTALSPFVKIEYCIIIWRLNICSFDIFANSTKEFPSKQSGKQVNIYRIRMQVSDSELNHFP